MTHQVLFLYLDFLFKILNLIGLHYINMNSFKTLEDEKTEARNSQR